MARARGARLRSVALGNSFYDIACMYFGPLVHARLRPAAALRGPSRFTYIHSEICSAAGAAEQQQQQQQHQQKAPVWHMARARGARPRSVALGSSFNDIACMYFGVHGFDQLLP